MNKIPTDIYYNLFSELNLRDIVKLCNTSKKFKEFCLQNQKYIATIKIKAIKRLLKDDDDKIRDFAYENKIGFDKISKDRAIRSPCRAEAPLLRRSYGFSNSIDKFTLDLLYLVNNNLLDEAYILITLTDNIPEPPLYIFTNKITKKIPKKIIELYIKKLPPILELFGYDNTEDFLEDFPIERFTNNHLQKYIKNELKNK